MRTNLERLIHSFKTALACIVASLLTKIIGLPADQWVVITVIVVMCAQIYVGSVIQKAYLRFLGTLVGCLLASFTLLFVGDTTLATLTTIAFSSFLFSYLATGQESLTYAGTLGAVTTAIILLGQHPTLLFAGERFIEISLGILIATFISQCVLPIHAQTHLRRAQVATLQQLSDFYAAGMTLSRTNTQTDYLERDENLLKSLAQQRQLAKESSNEPLGEKFNAPHFMLTLHREREMLRTMSLMHQALIHLQNTGVSLAALPELRTFNETIQQSLRTLISLTGSGTDSTASISLPDLSRLREAIYRQIVTPSTEQMIYMNGFLFCAEMLAHILMRY